MLKNCLFLILVLLMKPVFAASIMSHEKFVHLSYEEQKKIVITTMELIVEMEEKYKHQVKTSGFDPERFRRYTDFMKKVSNLLLFPEAHAVERNVRYGQYLNQLRTILGQRDRCIYGGWASEMVNNLCVHPSNSRFRNIYFADNGCSGIGKISCNPAIFGFKNVGQKSLFCVPAGRAGSASDNTSRECMNKALYSNESGASSREERIQNMIAGITSNPNDANAVFDFLLKACACDARSPEISQHYHTYMRPHRTCFSLLKMMAEVMPQCTVNPSLMDANQLSFLQHINTTVTEAEIRSSNPGNIDAIYRAAVVGNGSADSGFVSRADYRAICGGNPPVPAPTCADALKLSTGVCCEAPNRPNADRSACEPAGGVVVGGCTPPQVVNPAGGCMDAPAACTPPQVVNPAGGCMNPPAGGGDTTACTPPQIVNPAGGCMNPPAGGGDTTACTPPQVVNPAGGCMDAPAATCANGATNHPECTTCSTTQEMIANACVDKCIEGTGPRDATSNECSETCTDTAKEVVNNACVAKCATGETRNEAGVCGGASSGHTIEVKSTIKDLTSTTITVKVDGGSTLIPGHTIIWFKKGTNITNINFTGTSGTPPTETPIALTGDTPETSTEESDPATDTPPTNTTWDDPGTNETPIPTSSDDMEFTAPRHTTNYEVCARLVKVSDRSLAASSCATVQQKTQQAGPQGFNPQMQQMGPTRGGSSDAIFRGVR
ncbi:MAG: proline-rich domain-containing protein [Bdellovibrionota bacterium]